MGVQKIVFGSKEERKYYKKLMKTWGNQLNIYHNLPFLIVFTGKETMIDSTSFGSFQLNEQEYEFLKKTSIDYIICNKEDRPLLCIDFDGLQGGFNIGTNYVAPQTQNSRKRRKDNFELKLRVAHASSFPYFILCSAHFKGLSDSIYLTIADGLIGEVLSNDACQKAINSGFDPETLGFSHDEFDNLNEFIKRDIIEDWLTGIEIECDYYHNPIFQEVAKLEKETGSTGYSIMFLNDEEMDPSIWTWAECEIRNCEYGNEKAKVYLPNFKTPFCYFSVHLAQEIARLLALAKIKKRMRRRGKGSFC